MDFPESAATTRGTEFPENSLPRVRAAFLITSATLVRVGEVAGECEELSYNWQMYSKPKREDFAADRYRWDRNTISGDLKVTLSLDSIDKFRLICVTEEAVVFGE